MSLPNQNSADGGFKRRIGDTASGSTVPSHGAKMAIAIIKSSTTPPTIAVGWRRNASRRNCQVEETGFGAASTVIADMSVTNPRVEEHIRQIDREIDQHVDRREHQDHPLDDRVVATQDRVDGEAS